MNKLLCIPTGALLALLSLPVCAAQHIQHIAAANEVAPSERGGFKRHARATELAPFLGVETEPVGPALTAQLALPKLTGLVVREVFAGSPAAAVLQAHDILLKLDDQWLIESRQFAVLVRNHQPGDEVTLTYVRAGKQNTAKVKLTQHEAPSLVPAGGPGKDLLFHAEGPVRTGSIRHVLPLLRPDQAGTLPHVLPAPGLRATAVAPDNSTMVFTDERGTLNLTVKDGKKSLVAQSPKGENLYSGPIDTPEQREKLPSDIRERLEQIEGMKNFRFEIGPDFDEELEMIDADTSSVSISAGSDDSAVMQ